MQATTRWRRPRIGGPERQRMLLDRPWKVHLLQAAILVIVLVGAATGPLALLSGDQRAEAGAAAPPAPPSPVAATGFAELFVAAWLNRADPDHPEALSAFDPYVAPQDLAGMAPGQLYAARTVAIDATPAGTNYWAVTVAAEVLRSVKGSLRPAGTRYYGVGIGVARGRFIATSLPAQISPPPTAAPPPLWVGEVSPPLPGDPVADTLTQFFTAMLTGRGHLDRYVDPASGLSPLEPTPCATVALRAYGQAPTGAGQALAKAQAACVDTAGHTTVLEYWLDLEQTQGRWEVSRLHRAAPIAGPDSQQATGR